jgi:hypothetical protein
MAISYRYRQAKISLGGTVGRGGGRGLRRGARGVNTSIILGNGGWFTSLGYMGMGHIIRAGAGMAGKEFLGVF